MLEQRMKTESLNDEARVDSQKYKGINNKDSYGDRKRYN